MNSLQSQNTKSAPVKKPLALWVKILIAIGVLVGVGVTLIIGYVMVILITLGNAGTEYNDVVTKESERVNNSLAVASCNLSHSTHSVGNVDAIQKYYLQFSCGAVPANLDQLVADRLSALGYSNYQGLTGIYRNECCEIQYQTYDNGYVIGLYSNKVDGREEIAK